MVLRASGAQDVSGWFFGLKVFGGGTVLSECSLIHRGRGKIVVAKSRAVRFETMRLRSDDFLKPKHRA